MLVFKKKVKLNFFIEKNYRKQEHIASIVMNMVGFQYCYMEDVVETLLGLENR